MTQLIGVNLDIKEKLYGGRIIMTVKKVYSKLGEKLANGEFILTGELAANLVRQKFGASSAPELAFWMASFIFSRCRFDYNVPEYLVADV